MLLFRRLKSSSNIDENLKIRQEFETNKQYYRYQKISTHFHPKLQKIIFNGLVMNSVHKTSTKPRFLSAKEIKIGCFEVARGYWSVCQLFVIQSSLVIRTQFKRSI